MHQHRILNDTVYFWFAANDTSGSGGDGASPVYDVRLAGAAAGAIPVLSGSGTLLTHANFPPGCHEVEIAATTGNGFAAGNTYAVFCTLLVDSQNPSGFIGSFSLKPIIADLREMGGVSQSATDLKDFADAGYDPGTNKVQGVVLVDTTTTNTDMVGTDSAALASALTTHDNKIDSPANIDSGGATIADNLKKIADDNAGVDFDATTDSLEKIRNKSTDIETDTQDIQSRLPAALVSGRMSSDAVAVSGSTEAADNLEAATETNVIGAAASGTLSTTAMTTNLTETTNDHYNGRTIIWTSGVLQDQATDITDYDGSTKELTFTAVTEAPSAADTFVIV